MTYENTLTQLKDLRLEGMALGVAQQMQQVQAEELSFMERLTLLIEHEQTYRAQNKERRLIKAAKLKVSTACLEDVDYRPGRGLDKHQIAGFASCDWIVNHQSILITGAAGVGKTWLSNALGQKACRCGFSVLHLRVPRLFESLRIAHVDGTFTRKLAAIAKIDLLILDDWGLQATNAEERSDLLEIMDDRVGTRSTIITSQLPVEHWHEYLNDPTLADAILDRIVHRSHKIKLKGESMRKPKEEMTEKSTFKRQKLTSA